MFNKGTFTDDQRLEIKGNCIIELHCKYIADESMLCPSVFRGKLFPP